MEYVSLEGLRLDGRRPKETRRMRCELTALPGSDGSAVFELGNTKVLAAVHGPHECRRPSERLEDRLLVKCEVSMAAFSTGERRRRTKGDRRTNELSTFVRRCIETCVSAELLARSQLDVSIQVLQADGGVRAAAVNAAVLAIVDAGIPMQDTMACCSAGFLDDTPLLDLNYMEVRNPSSPQMPRQIPSVRLFFFSHRRSGAKYSD
jgi:exosome complex component RRP41